MKREEFIKKYKNDCRYYFDGYYSDCIDDFLTNIYNDHEAQLKAKDEEIVALKAECEYDQRNAARSQRESVSLLDKLKAKDERIKELEEAMKHKTCEGCKYFRNSDKACFKSSQNTYIRPASISFSGCGEFKPKEQ